MDPNAKKYLFHVPRIGLRTIQVIQPEPGSYRIGYLTPYGAPETIHSPDFFPVSRPELAQRALDQFAARRQLKPAP
jgi:hypothetical protein